MKASINTLPTAPLRTMSPADFVAAANTFLAASGALQFFTITRLG